MATKTFLKSAVAILVLLFIVSPSNAASLKPVGHLEGGTTYGVPYSVSANGLVVVGRGVSASGSEAYRWENGIMIGLGDLPGDVFYSEAYDVSADGSVVVGVSAAASGKEAFRWENGAITGLGDLPGGEFRSNAIAVSANGLVIAGSSDSATGHQAFRWENGIMKGLGYLTGGAYSHARGISADGSVVVGNSDSSYGRLAFRWENGTMTELGDLPGGSVWSVATDVSDDCSVVVGASYSASGREAIRWTASTGMVALGVLPDGYYNSFAHAVSADGSVVVGISGDRAFIWNQINGMRNLKELLESKYRLDLTGWSLYSATDVSADGLTIIGEGCGPEGCEDWIAVLSKPEPAVIYVDSDAPLGGDGMSWEGAYNYLQDALAAAWSGDEIRVAQGIYKPDQGAVVTTGDREATFQLVNGVTIKGGYAGTGAPKPNARDIELYETILSGDLVGNDVELKDPCDFRNDPSRDDNSYHVVTGSGTDETAVLDGFAITAGNADRADVDICGAGLLNYLGGSPTLFYCTFQGNIAIFGGGVYNQDDSNPILSYCTFYNNYADGHGGGIYNALNSSPTLTHCTFNANIAASGSGGAIGNFISFCSPTLTNCIFSGNYATGSGGGMYNAYNSYSRLTNCIFIGNVARYGGGGGMHNWDSNSTLINCTFSGNQAKEHYRGGGILNEQSNPSLRNCILWGNMDKEGVDESAQIYGGNPFISYTCIQGLDMLEGNGNSGADPCFVEMGYWQDPCNTPYYPWDDMWIEGDYHLLQDSHCIDAGDPNYIVEPNETDLDGKPRIINGRIDMGAYESRYPRIIYVDDDAEGANNGSSWADAFNFLQDALAVAYSGDEIRVAQGIYKPDQGAGITAGDREATFQLIDGVIIKGGFAGYGQTDPNARDIEIYQTILTGDLAGDDGQNFSNNSENSYQVVNSISVGSTAILDGFIITAGNANHPHYLSMKISGGGMYMLYSSPTIIDCIFTSNSAAYGGAGLSNYKGNPILTNCTFPNNLAASHPHYGGSGVGAGMRNSTGSPILTKCIFSNNHAKGRYPGDFGGVSGGLHCYVETSNDLDKGPTLIDCIFTDNTAQSAAGGMCPGGGNTTLINCIFTRNYAESGGAMASAPRMMVNCLLFENSAEYGGAMYFCEDKNNLIINCTFVANSATFVGGILDCEDSIANLTNCILFNNTSSGVADEQAQIYLPDGTPVLNYNCIQGWTGDLGGDGNIGSDPLFVDPINNDYHLLTRSLCIDAGDPDYVAEPNETDLDGRSRVINGRIDMGAYESPIFAQARILPRTINLASKGKSITCYIRLPEGYNVADIEPNSIFLMCEIEPEQFTIDEQQQVATAKFSREDVQPILEVGDIDLTITGRLTDGTLFEGTDSIKVLNKAGKN